MLKCSKAQGAFLSSPASWNEKLFKEYYNSPVYNFDKGWYGNKNIWKTYNEFFSRKVKPGSRPVTQPENNSIVVAPADSVPQGVWRLDKKSRIKSKGQKVKFVVYYNAGKLLKKNSKYQDAFRNGYFTHTYLNVNDYHRYHFPLSGVVKEKGIITQNVALLVRWDPTKKQYQVEDTTGWQFSQTRGYIILQTKKYGLVAIVPVGMEMVSSINFDKNVTIGSYHKKGTGLGYFLFGGSDIIMLFQAKSHFKMDAPKNSDGTFKHILVGQEYGKLSLK